MVVNRSSVAKRYAQAFSTLNNEGSDKTISELDDLIRHFVAEPQLWAQLNNRSMTTADRLKQVKEGHEGLSPQSLALLHLILEHDRVQLLPEILTALHRQHLDETGQMQLTVISAVPLSDGQSSELQIALEKRFGRSVIVQPKVDPQILGGLVVMGEAWELDLSLRTRLTQLQAQLESGEARP